MIIIIIINNLLCIYFILFNIIILILLYKYFYYLKGVANWHEKISNSSHVYKYHVHAFDILILIKLCCSAGATTCHQTVYI